QSLRPIPWATHRHAGAFSLVSCHPRSAVRRLGSAALLQQKRLTHFVHRHVAVALTIRGANADADLARDLTQRRAWRLALHPKRGSRIREIKSDRLLACGLLCRQNEINAGSADSRISPRVRRTSPSTAWLLCGRFRFAERRTYWLQSSWRHKPLRDA